LYPEQAIYFVINCEFKEARNEIKKLRLEDIKP